MPAEESVYTIEGSLLTDIASAIRSKTGSSLAFTPAQMASEILNIPSGGGGGNYWYDWTGLEPVTNFVNPWSGSFELIDSTIKGVTGSGVFARRSGLTKVDLPECQYIGYEAFSWCENLSSINLPKCEYIESYAFYSCSALSGLSINLPECQCIRGGAFNNTHIQYISLPKCQVCTGLGNTDISEIYLPACTCLNGGFYHCSLLERVDLPICRYIGMNAFTMSTFQESSPNLVVNAPQCRYIESEAFAINGRLKELDLPLCSFISNRAFSGCGYLSRISLPECQIIGYEAFESCTKLSSISLPKCSYLETRAFYNCTMLESVFLGSSFCSINLNVRSSSVSLVFYSTKIARGLGYIYVPSSLYSQYYNDPGWSWYRSALVSY